MKRSLVVFVALGLMTGLVGCADAGGEPEMGIPVHNVDEGIDPDVDEGIDPDVDEGIDPDVDEGIDPDESAANFTPRNFCEEWGAKWIEVILATPDISGGYESLAAGPEILQPQFQAMADTWTWVAEALPSDQEELIENSRMLAEGIAAIVPLLTLETVDQIDFSEHDELAGPVSAYFRAECSGFFNGIDPSTMFAGLEEISWPELGGPE